MVTAVGTQSEFKVAMTSLLELEFDAVEAYKVAVEKLEKAEYKTQVQKFLHDHEKHIKTIEQLLNDHDVDFIRGPDAKQFITKGKVMLAGLIGDKSILLALITNGIDIKAAYERLLERRDDWKDAYAVLHKHLDNEIAHRKWLEETLKGV